MPSSTPTSPKYGQRIKYLGIGIIILGLLYTGAWFWGTSRLKEELSSRLIQQQGNGQSVKCANLDIRGFPFRVGVFCDEVGFDDPAQSVSFKMGAVRSAAQVYNLTQGIVEFDGPLELSLPGNDKVQASWSLLRASAKVDQPLPKRASLEATDFSISLPAQFERPVMNATNIQTHFRTVGQDVDLAASSKNMLIDRLITDGRDIPAFDFSADIGIKNGVALALSGERDLKKLLLGQSATLRAVSLTFTGGGGFTLSGPVSFDGTGLMNADLSVSFSEATKLGQTIEKIAPELASYVALSLSLAASTAKPGTDPKIDITIRNGRAAIGIIPLGQIPPVR